MEKTVSNLELGEELFVTNSFYMFAVAPRARSLSIKTLTIN